MTADERESADTRKAASRVIVVLETGARPAPLLDAAAQLAAAMGAELRVVLVEDVRLRHAAALPFTRELGVTSAHSRPFDALDMERALRVQAELLRRALEATAGAWSLSWALDVVRGELLAAAFSHAGETDYLVLGRGGAPFGRMESAATVDVRQQGAIAALDDGSEESKRALLAALAFAERLGDDQAEGELIVLVAAEGPEAFRKRRGALGAWLAQRGIAASDYVFVPRHDAGAVARALQALRAAVLFWPATAAREAQAVLLGRVSCPVVLIP